MTYYKPEQHLNVDKFMVPYFGKHGAKQSYRIHGNQLSLATSAVGTGKTVAMLCSISSVSKDTCNTVKTCHRFYFLDQGHSSVNMYEFSATNHWIVKGTLDDVPNQNALNLPVLLQSLQCLSTS